MNIDFQGLLARFWQFFKSACVWLLLSAPVMALSFFLPLGASWICELLGVPSAVGRTVFRVVSSVTAAFPAVFIWRCSRDDEEEFSGDPMALSFALWIAVLVIVWMK